ncbi:MAG: beta-galactosidase [Phycisphaeraceae bacterium]|nr:beta-galactosidase [Phycisphaeraceae bacterium]
MSEPLIDELDRNLWIGASWYPEMWPRSEWPKDIARMNELGFNVVRLFEFAWHRFEPSEGRFDFQWAVELLDQLHKAGIGVILGTPTAAPPAWLTSTYPEVLKVHHDGTPAGHGQRKHGSHISPVYREHCGRIVGQMARQLGGHPAVIAWQIDNEMSGHDYSPAAREAFIDWMKRRYGTPEKLNAAWGLEFWSQAYDHFAQIPMPLASVGGREIPERHHPSLIIAIARFQSDQWTQYIDHQCRAIREHAPINRPITTNMVHSLAMHWYQHNRVLDRVGHSLYRDAEHYAWNLLPYDRMRAEKPGKLFWLLETAPNWSGGGQIWNIHQASDGLKAMSWLTIALGGSMMLFWQWRQHWAGQEMQHGVHVSATGQWMPNHETWKQLAADFKRHEQWLTTNRPQPAHLAILMSNENAWAWSIDPIGQDMNYGDRFRDDYHGPLAMGHWWRDIICPEADLSPYRVLLLPMLPMLSDSLRQRLHAWVRAGGRLLLGPLTGYRTEEFTCHLDQSFGGLEELIGAGLEFPFSPMWTEDRSGMEWENGRISRVSTYCHAWKPTTGRPIAWYRQPARDGRAAGYGHDQCAAIDHAVGKGRVITLGSRIPPEDYLAVVADLCGDAGIAPLASGDKKIVVVPRGGDAGQTPAGYCIVNLNLTPARVALRDDDASFIDLLARDRAKAQVGNDIQLQPLQAMILKRN